MTVRIEVFKNVDKQAPVTRRYIALAEGIEYDLKGRRVISACITFFASTADKVRFAAEAWLADEHRKVREAEELVAKRAKEHARRRA